MGPIVSRAVFTPPDPTYCVDQKSFHTVRNPRDGHEIPVVAVTHKKPRLAILYSHGNAEDLGQVVHWCEALSIRFHASVFSYDYRGYGPSSSRATEANVFSDVQAVTQHVQRLFRDDQIVFFGRSLGCAPSIRAASLTPGAKGLILESPFLSCVKTVVHTPWTFWFDMFRNEVGIRDCAQPTLIIHGKRDSVVPFAHGEKLYDECPNPWGCLWLEGAGHNDIDTRFRSELFQKIDHFIGQGINCTRLTRRRK